MDLDSSVFSLGNNEACWFRSSLLSLNKKKWWGHTAKFILLSCYLKEQSNQLVYFWVKWQAVWKFTIIIINIIYYIQSGPIHIFFFINSLAR